MKRVPVMPTILVALAVVAMIALGLWQLLDRLPRKEAYLAQLAANPARSPIAFPTTPDDTLLFRRSSGLCLQPTIRLAGAGAAGFRALATCTGGMAVQLGTVRDPAAKVMWAGGTINGYLSHAPDARPLIVTMFDHAPQAMLLVADRPPEGLGLAPNQPLDLDGVPNNHLAYAGQWFFFAAVAAIIYTLALRRRARD